jgi:hypothetical protein
MQETDTETLSLKLAKRLRVGNGGWESRRTNQPQSGPRTSKQYSARLPRERVPTPQQQRKRCPLPSRFHCPGEHRHRIDQLSRCSFASAVVADIEKTPTKIRDDPKYGFFYVLPC